MFVFLVVLALVVTGIFYLRYRIASPEDKGNLELSIDQEVAKVVKGTKPPGLIVGVYKNGRTYINSHGTVSKSSSQPPDGNTAFQIGSVTKIFTASLLQSLCDEGVVSMDDTLDKLIGRLVPLASSVKNITLRHLVTHRSGFPKVPESLLQISIDTSGEDKLMLDPYSHLKPQHIFEYLTEPEGQSSPGRFEYSNYGMGLLAHVLELVTDRDFESLVRDKVLLPNQMNDTLITLTPEIETKLAQGHTMEGEETPIWTFSALSGAGAYTSNVRDMLTFIEASVADSGDASQRLQKMSKPQFGGTSATGWMLPSFIERFLGNRGIVWHNGMVGGYASYLSIDKDAKAGVVLLTNQACSLDMLGMMLMRQVRTQSWAIST